MCQSPAWRSTKFVAAGSQVACPICKLDEGHPLSRCMSDGQFLLSAPTRFSEGDVREFADEEPYEVQ